MDQESSLRVFLDSNVIISGLYKKDSPPGQILRLFTKGDIKVVVSQHVLEEVIGTIKEKFPEIIFDLNTMLIRSKPDVVAAPGEQDVKRWGNKISIGDAEILAAAVLARPHYLITGDNHFLHNIALKQGLGFEIVSPVQFLEYYLIRQLNNA
jgi:putative PIN family toxin of toxin-antitoxin system